MTDDLLSRFNADFDSLEQREPIILELDAVAAWVLLSNLQLALRHPLNTGPSAQIGRKIARLLRDLIAPSGALREVFDRGWNPAFDEEVSHGDPGGSPGRDGPDVRPDASGAVVEDTRDQAQGA